MTETYLEKPSQEERILRVLKNANGAWINGRYFIQEMMISQAHARIFGLQKKGYNIEASQSKDEYGFKSYRLIEDPQISLL